MRTALLIAASSLALAGCGATGSAGNSSTTTTTTASSTTTLPSAASFGIKPGKWENKVEILDVDLQMEGATPQMTAAMKKGMAGSPPQVVTSCLTPEQAAKGPSAAMLDKMHCKFNKADFGGGHIASEMVCEMPNGTLTSNGDGTYTPTSYSVDGHGSMSGRMKMTMHTRTTGRWLGECDGTEAGAKGAK